jgi:hypothetical protein
LPTIRTESPLTTRNSTLLSVGFGHADYGEGETVWEWDFDAFEDLVAAGEIEGDAGEGGSHFEAGEAGGAGGGFAGFEDFAADATAGEIGVNEESADFGGVGGGIKEFGFTDFGMVAAEEGFAFAPAATANEDVGAGGASFGDKISAVGDELGIETEDSADGAVELGGSVVVALEDADGVLDELVKSGDVGFGGEAEGEVKRGC